MSDTPSMPGPDGTDKTAKTPEGGTITNLYVLDGHTPRLATLAEYGEQRCENLDSWIVAKTRWGEVEVSTVFLGIDHGREDGGPPVLFETMVFGGPLNGEQDRYSTWEEAEAGHAGMVRRVSEAMQKRGKPDHDCADLVSDVPWDLRRELALECSRTEQLRGDLLRVEGERDRLREELMAVLGELQRLQPAGSPPPGGPAQLAQWIRLDVANELRLLREENEQLRRNSAEAAALRRSHEEEDP